MKKLPIGIQSFSEMINGGYIYIDKTAMAYKLIDNGKYYFLSRPRRFGKSLFLDTLKEIFKGSKELFKGLYIYDKWDWSRKYPVIKISFGHGVFTEKHSIIKKLEKDLRLHCEEYDISYDNIADLTDLVLTLKKEYNEKVVILIDEYDKPILDNIENKEMAKTARTILMDFYGAIKDLDEYLKFVFLTGVSRFSKMNLFSKLNNLDDITIDSNYATITGYTHHDIETHFSEYLKDVNLEMVKKWYNGYNYFGEPVYNPFDILLFISKGCEFKNYWWTTGNPSFLIEMLKQQHRYYIPELENILVDESILDAFDVERIDLIALLWQTGYLTFDKKIVDELSFAITYKLKVPNLEIQKSLNTLFLNYLTNIEGKYASFASATAKALREGDFIALETSLKSLFAAIPYANYAHNIIAHYEGYYSSVLFTHIASIGYDLIPEDYTNKGRIDLTVKAGENIFIFEFKVDSGEPPIKQIKEKKYYEKYLSENKKIFLIGINFSSKEKNISEFKCETL